MGWKIAEPAGRTRSLSQLAAMTPAQSRALVEQTLQTMVPGAKTAPEHPAGSPR